MINPAEFILENARIYSISMTKIAKLLHVLHCGGGGVKCQVCLGNWLLENEAL